MNEQFRARHPGEKFIQNLFDRIARRYDLLNRIISLHLDTRWRARAIRAALKPDDRLVLDLGTGTGDLALAAARRIHGRGKIIGLDISLEMLRLARAKSQKSKCETHPVFVLGSALAPPLRDGLFDVVMTAFVLRNVPDLPLFFRKAYKLLGPSGRLVTLDMFPPAASSFSLLYALYFYRLVPWIGARVAGERGAYKYLSDSVKAFDPPESVARLIRQAGFANVTFQRFLRGAVCLHLGEKPDPSPPQV